MTSVINDYINESVRTPAVQDLRDDLFQFFHQLDKLQTVHKLLSNELETTYLAVANLTGLGQFHRTLLANYGVHYNKIALLFADHASASRDIFELAVNKIKLAQELDAARLALLQGLAVHRMKDVELTYYITHDPRCRGYALKIVSLDKQFKRAIEHRDKKFDTLHSMVFAMIRIQQEFINTFTETAADLVGSSVNKDFLKLIGERTEYLNSIMKKCIKSHMNVNDKYLKNVYRAFEKYREYNRIDIGFKIDYVSDGTFDSNFKMYKKLSTALDTTINELKEELAETEVREKLGFDARQQKVLIATNPKVVALEAKRSAIKKSINVRSVENVAVYTNIKQCIKQHGHELKECVNALSGIKNNSLEEAAEYKKYVDTLKKMKGMVGKYSEISDLLAKKIVEIAQYHERTSINEQAASLALEAEKLAEVENRIAEEKARLGESMSKLSERNRETGMPSLPMTATENAAHILQRIKVGGSHIRSNPAAHNTSSYGQDDGQMRDSYDYAHRSVTKFGPVAFTSGIPAEISLDSTLRKANPLLYLSTGGALPGSTWSNPITGYKFQMNIVDGGLYGQILKNEFLSYDKCVANNKILIANALNKDLAIIRAMPDSHPHKATLYNDLIKIQQNIDQYAEIHACGTTYERTIQGINKLGFDFISKDKAGTTTSLPNYKVDADRKKYGKYTPAEVDQMMTFLDMYIDSYGHMMMDFDSRCKTTEEMTNRNYLVLEQLVADVQFNATEQQLVKNLIDGIHHTAYTALTGSYLHPPAPINDISLREYIYNEGKQAVRNANIKRQEINNKINQQIKELEYLRTQYRVYLNLVKMSTVNYNKYYVDYTNIIDAIYNATTNALFANSPVSKFEMEFKNEMEYVFNCYLGLFQGVSQAVYIIYANIPKYHNYHARAVQERINQYAGISREFVNNTFKEQLLWKEFDRLESVMAANDLRQDWTGGGHSVINPTRHVTVEKIKSSFKKLDNPTTRDTFKSFVSSERLNVLPANTLLSTINDISEFQNNLVVYANQVAKESNVLAEVTNQMTYAYKTLVRQQTELLYQDAQLRMIELFSLPLLFSPIPDWSGTVIRVGGVYPMNIPDEDTDNKTNFEFIRFLCKRMMENDRISKFAGQLQGYINQGLVIRGGNNEHDDLITTVADVIAKKYVNKLAKSQPSRPSSLYTQNTANYYKLMKTLKHSSNQYQPKHHENVSEPGVKVPEWKKGATWTKSAVPVVHSPTTTSENDKLREIYEIYVMLMSNKLDIERIDEEENRINYTINLIVSKYPKYKNVFNKMTNLDQLNETIAEFNGFTDLTELDKKLNEYRKIHE